MIALFTGHFLQTSRHFAERFRPTGSRIGNDRNRVAHIAEILRNRDTRINRSLARRNRHIRGVRNQHRALHQRFSRFGVNQFGKFAQNVGHFVSALTAADIDHKIHVAPFCKLMLNNRLTRAERSRDARRSALCNREQRVDGALTRNHRINGRQLLPVRSRHTDGPLLHQGQILHCAVRELDAPDAVGDTVIPRAQLDQCAAHLRRNHDLMQNHVVFLHRSEDIPRSDLFAEALCGFKMPDFFTIQRRLIQSSDQIRTNLFPHCFKRALNPVENIGQKPRSELHRQRRTCGNHLVASSEPGRFLIYLNRGTVAVHFDDLADQLLRTDPNHVEQIRFAHSLGNDQRS